MKMFKLYRSMDLKIGKDECWEFFSNPVNLKTITPDYMGFDIVEGGDCKMFQGQIIAYKVSPLLGLKLNWVTEITHVKEGQFFVDEQRFGPYKFWHHKHFFEEKNGGMRCVDEVHYGLSAGIFSSFVNKLMVASKLKQIFDYRTKVLTEKFGTLA